MRKTLLILISFILILSASACEKKSDEEQELGQATPTTVVEQSSPTPASTIAPTPAPTVAPTATTMPTTTPIATTTPAPTQTPKYKFVGEVHCTAIEFVNIRQEANTSSAVLGTFPAGKTADVIKYLKNWVHISYGDMVGYVSRSYTIGKSAPSIAVPMGEWASILVNPTNLLPDEFEVTLADFEGGQVDVHILSIAEQMFADAKGDGVDLLLVDAYRSYETQNEQYLSMVQRYLNKGYSQHDAEVKAATITARPDTSEHQTGLVLDIVTPSHTKRNSGFADTDAFEWLYANAQNYGFTLRYKQGKEPITKVIYESWHWRFVGVAAAKDMKASGECLEEYLGILD